MKLFYKVKDVCNNGKDCYQYLNSDLVGTISFLSGCDDYGIYIDGVFHNTDYDTFKKIKQCFQELAQEDSKTCKGKLWTVETEAEKDLRLNTANNQNNQIKQTYKDILKPLDPEVIKNLESLPRITKTDFDNFYMIDLENSLAFCKRNTGVSKEYYINILKGKINLMEQHMKNNIINKLQSNPWDPRKPEYNEKGELTSVTIEFKEDESNDQEEDTKD